MRSLFVSSTRETGKNTDQVFAKFDEILNMQQDLASEFAQFELKLIEERCGGGTWRNEIMQTVFGALISDFLLISQ